MSPRRPKALDSATLSYRRAVSAAVVMHARYLSVRDDKSVTQHLIDRRREAWLLMEARRARLRARVAGS